MPNACSPLSHTRWHTRQATDRAEPTRLTRLKPRSVVLMMPIDIDIEAIRSRNEARRHGRTAAGERACEADVEALLEALAAAERELHRLHEDNEDLRASSEIWADLYVGAVERANAPAASAPARSSRAEYEIARDKVAVLREALDALVRECDRCAPGRAGEVANVPLEQFCEICARAVAALSATRAER
jgi:hypothetical protein